MKNFLELKPVDEVLSIIKKAQCLSSELVNLSASQGRYLADAFHAPANLPGFDRSTVDGYAARARDLFGASETSPALLRMIGECEMGIEPGIELKPGETAIISTGAMLPKGADCVAMVEHSRQARDGLIEISRSQAPGDNVVLYDDDAAAGQELIPAGKLIRPQEIGALAAFGITEVRVIRKPRAAILSTGDEIVRAGSALLPGQVYDVNSFTVAAICRANCAETMRLGIIRDSGEKLERGIMQALSCADVVVVSGSSSAGQRDIAVEAFRKMPEAEIFVHGVAISPGKPFILGKSGSKWLVGLPGHVAGAIICAKIFLAPLLRQLQGGISSDAAPAIEATLSRSVSSAQGRRDYIRCRLEKKGDGFAAIPIMAPSALISGLVEAEGYIICPENSEGLAAGETVNVQLF